MCFIHLSNNVNNWWVTSNLPLRWHRTTSTTSGRKSLIFNRNSSGERQLKFTARGEDDHNKKPCAKHREHRIAQRRQRCQHSDHKHVQRQQQNTPITYTANGADEEREHRLLTLQKVMGRSGNAYMYSLHKIIFFDATIGSNSYTTCTMQVKNIFPMDWGQPTSRYTMSNIGFYSKLY